LFFVSEIDLTNAGGVIANSTSMQFDFQATVCDNSDCSYSSGLSVRVERSASTLTGTPLTITAVPLPASLPLLLGSLVGLRVLRRRRQG
jgi:hypothetical protein